MSDKKIVKVVNAILYDMYELPNDSYVRHEARSREAEYLIEALKSLGFRLVECPRPIDKRGNVPKG